MTALTIADTAIRRDEAGRYCLNDLHRASGGNQNHRPGEWLRNKQTRELVAELETAEIPAVGSKEGATGGTYVAKELVYAYAMWISPAFHLKVIRAYDALVTAPPSPLNLADPAVLRAALLGYTEKVIALEATVAQQAPKVAALDRIATAAGSICITDAAKSLQVQPKALFRTLQECEWIYRRPGGSGWIAYQRRIQSGLLEHKVTTITRNDGSDKVVEQVLVTPRGLTALSEKLGNLIMRSP